MSLEIYIYRLWYILYSDSVNSGIVIFDFSTNTTNVHEARIIYIRIFTNVYILMLYYQGFTRVDHSTTAQPKSNSSAILQGRSRLSRFERFTYVSRRIRPHLCSFLSRAFTFFFLLGCSSWSRIDPVGPGFTTTKGFGLRLSRISLKDFRRSSRTARRRPQRRGNEETAARGIRGRRSEGGRSKDEESESSCLSKGKRYLLGRWGGLEERETARK